VEPFDIDLLQSVVLSFVYTLVVFALGVDKQNAIDVVSVGSSAAKLTPPKSPLAQSFCAFVNFVIFQSVSINPNHTIAMLKFREKRPNVVAELVGPILGSVSAGLLHELIYRSRPPVQQNTPQSKTKSPSTCSLM
jgi:hypothetical protein